MNDTFTPDGGATPFLSPEGKTVYVPKEEAYSHVPEAPFQLKTYPYRVDGTGVWLGKKQLLMHPLLVTGVVENREESRTLLRLGYLTRGDWREITVPKEALATKSGVAALARYDLAVTSRSAEAVGEYVNYLHKLNEDDLPFAEGTSTLGWTSGGFTAFAPYSGAAFDGPPEMEKRYRAVKVRGDAASWAAGVEKLREESLPLRLAIAASAGSALMAPLKVSPFFLHFWGRTGLGKTVILKTAASVWGSPEDPELISSYNATDVGLEYAATFLKDVPLIIDELQIGGADGAGDFRRLIYTLSEGISRVRGKKEGGVRTVNTWSNAILSSGEDPLNDERSAGGRLNRVIEVELTERLTLDFGPLLRAVERNYGFAGQKLVALLPDHLDKLRAIFDEFCAGLTMGGISGKLSRAGALILTADFLLTGLFFKESVPIGVNELLPYLIREAQICPEKKAFDYVLEVIAQNPGKIEGMAGSSLEREHWGKLTKDGTHVALVASKFRELVKASGVCEPRAVASYLVKKGLVETDPKGRTSKSVSLGGISVKAYYIVLPEKKSENVTE